jgi:hypothetical protein
MFNNIFGIVLYTANRDTDSFPHLENKYLFRVLDLLSSFLSPTIKNGGNISGFRYNFSIC